jgi:hypothetical protein
MLANPRHEAFAQAVALGKSGAAAYRECVSGGKCSDRTAEVASSRLLTEGSEVAVRVAELRGKVAAKVEKRFSMDRDRWLEELAGIAQEARGAEDYSAATGALAQIGKAGGWYEAEKHQVTVKVVIGGNADADS